MKKITLYKASILKYQFINFCYKIYVHIRFYLTKNFRKKHVLDHDVIVTLTSYPLRFSSLHLTIMSLMSQRISPDKIILWLYEQDYYLLPSSVKKLECDIFHIKKLNVDIRSYKKLVPTLENFPNSYLVTADDDFCYPYNWLKSLLNAYRPNANEIVGLRAHRIKLDQNNQIIPYKKWEWNIGDCYASKSVFLTSGAGVLIPPNSLHPEVLNSSVFTDICATSDDVWLYFMGIKNNFIFRKVGGVFSAFVWFGSQNDTLANDNVENNVNDINIRKMLEKYGNPFKEPLHKSGS